MNEIPMTNLSQASELSTEYLEMEHTWYSPKKNRLILNWLTESLIYTEMFRHLFSICLFIFFYLSIIVFTYILVCVRYQATCKLWFLFNANSIYLFMYIFIFGCKYLYHEFKSLGWRSLSMILQLLQNANYPIHNFIISPA